MGVEGQSVPKWECLNAERMSGAPHTAWIPPKTVFSG
jgi:hypothetical protein